MVKYVKKVEQRLPLREERRVGGRRGISTEISEDTESTEIGMDDRFIFLIF
jgi:hypothetical protein